MAAPSVQELWRRGQRGWPASFPVVQAPNPPLLVALGGLALAKAASGATADTGRAVFLVALGAWAWLELTDGDTPLRRLLGAGGLVYAVGEIADALG